ncbi:hypothetical protein DU475_18940 [Rhodopseudomonas sp. WA056]|uniref:hypothetical protein n=1 Tax=Rhodopseudomonas sp. WA056 TaxID=2269367 RepID=UPI0013DF4DD1|nr:hypothetical protein [Rhodopseudomonas sp. WA056]NEW89326.1 hypothetical protein [Rhodopseudomonas sp. WA056]
MTSISSAASGSYLSPLQMLQKELASEVSAGTVNSTDADALSTALQDIDTALQSSRASGSAGSPPSDMKSKIDDLIATEVSNGTLTSDQAAELQSLFQNTFAGGAAGGAGGPPPPPPPPPDDSSGSVSSVSSSSSSSSSSDVSEVLKEFLKLLQEQQSSSTASSYGASGNATSSSSFSALLINYQV